MDQLTSFDAAKERPALPAAGRFRMTYFTKLGEVEGTLRVEELQVAEDVLLDLFGFGFGVDLLELGDDLLNGVLAVAALDDFEARTVEAKSALGHKQDTLIVIFAEADAHSEAGPRIRIHDHAGFSSG